MVVEIFHDSQKIKFQLHNIYTSFISDFVNKKNTLIKNILHTKFK